jgi:CHAD domain-containing protein
MGHAVFNFFVMKKLIRQYKALIQTFLSLLNKPAGKLQQEDIHQIRVCIKRLKAIHRFLYALSPPRFKAMKKDCFHSLFSTAGKVRELHVLRNTLIPYSASGPSLEGFIMSLSKPEKECMRDFIKTRASFNITVLDKRLQKLESGEKRWSQKDLRKAGKLFIQKKVKKIPMLSNSYDDKKHLHRIRKSLKGLEPVLVLEQTIRPTDKLKETIKKMRLLNKLIGSWHDLVVLEHHLRLFIKQQKAGSANSGLVLMCRQLAIEEALIIPVMNKQLKELLQRF